MINRSLLVALAHFVSVGILLKILGLILPCCVTYYYISTACVVLWLLTSRYTLPLVKRRVFVDKIQPENRAVFITGCDSGFGLLLAKKLDLRGFHVFASCLSAAGDGAMELKRTCSKRLEIVALDVTKPEDAKHAIKYVKENLGTSELWALVNNASAFKCFDIELAKYEDFQDVMKVNVFGRILVTKAFLPLLRQSMGRVINVTSAAGRVALPHFSPYTISEFAATAFNDCLRQEVEPWGIRVISVEPEVFKNRFQDTNVDLWLEEAMIELDQDVKSDYGEKFFKNYKSQIEFNMSLGSSNTELVVKALEKAVSLKEPELSYKPRRNYIIKFVAFLLENVPTSIFDLTTKVYKSITGFPTPKEAENTL